MSALKNKVRLVGNLINKPDISDTVTGRRLARFSVATNETYRNSKGEKVTETHWHNIIACGKLAGIAEKYLDKGRQIAIEGRLVNRSYVDKEGIRKCITEVQVSELLLLVAEL